MHLYLDYTAPVEEIRNEFKRLVEASPLWDRRAAAIHVTNATENTMEIRALISAADGGKAFDLRCYIREHLLTFVQKNYPGSLPKTRTYFDTEDKGLPQPEKKSAHDKTAQQEPAAVEAGPDS